MAKQQWFSKVNLKAMKLELQLAQRETPQVDKDTISIRQKKRLAKAIVDEDKALSSFEIANKIQKIIRTQQKIKKMRKQT